MLYRHGLSRLFVLVLGLLSHNAARADLIFVTNGGSIGTIGEYTTAGLTVNPTLISGLSGPAGIAVSGSDLFVSNFGNGTIGRYTTAGTPVNRALISGLSNPRGIAVSGSDLFVVDGNNSTIGKYNTAGAPVNPVLISGLSFPFWLGPVCYWQWHDRPIHHRGGYGEPCPDLGVELPVQSGGRPHSARTWQRHTHTLRTHSCGTCH